MSRIHEELERLQGQVIDLTHDLNHTQAMIDELESEAHKWEQAFEKMKCRYFKQTITLREISTLADSYHEEITQLRERVKEITNEVV